MSAKRGRLWRQRLALTVLLVTMVILTFLSDQTSLSELTMQIDYDGRNGLPFGIEDSTELDVIGNQNGQILQNEAQICTEKRNFVYIKEIKCASQTLVNIFRRFGYARTLSFVLPVGYRLYLGWPYAIERGFYRPSKSGGFNILCEHSVYDKTRMESLMPRDSVFLTSLREPFAQFKSMFNYYSFQKILNITSPDPIREYLHNLDKYERLYSSPSVSYRYCIPDGFSMSKNLMSYTLGFPTGFLPGTQDMSANDSYIVDWLADLDKRFSLVLLTEYFHESLVFLKRTMCWDFTDIIYFTHNVGSYNYRDQNDPELVDIYRRHSPVDFKLYDHFNRTFWRKVSEIENDFFGEVNHFTLVLKDVTEFCLNLIDKKITRGTNLRVRGSPWNKPFDVDETKCNNMKNDNLKLVKEQYDRTYPKLNQTHPQQVFC